MKNKVSKIFNGIVIFGAPGSGKTTLAKLLSKSLPDSVYEEASHLLINTAVLLKKLPPGEARFIRSISRLKSSLVIPREEAREISTRLRNKYSPSVLAKALIYIHKKRFSNKFLIIAGARGYKSALYFKKNNYLVVYLRSSGKTSVIRLAKRERFSRKIAEKEKEIEERLFSTDKIESIADFSFDISATDKKEIAKRIKIFLNPKECRRCVNSDLNLSDAIGKSGLCDVCEKYVSNFNEKIIADELKLFLFLRNTGRGKYDAMVGISGGKDSTATLYEVGRFGFMPLAFSFDTGYYPKHIFQRAKWVAKKLKADYEKIDIRKYIRPSDRLSFKKTADLYDEKDSEELRHKFQKWYVEGRRHYSIKCNHAMPFVRTCQLCRRIVIRGYYNEALKHGVRTVILGINEWAGLSQDSESEKFIFSAIRKLKPFKNKPAVYVIHLPFLLRRRIGDTKKILKRLGWNIPRGEDLIESNANSCLFARAAENKARRFLGFHPDITRLAREVTVGFISKKQAKKALAKVHNYQYSVRSVLKRARVFKK